MTVAAPVVVLDATANVVEAARRLREGGHRVQDGLTLPEEPFDLAEERLLCAATIVTADDALRALVAAGRGAGLILAIDASLEAADVELFIRDLEKLGPVRREPAGPGGPPSSSSGVTGRIGSLTADQRQLLGALAGGASIPVAARELFISVRTAERRVGEARKVLGVRTTAEAVAMLAMAGSGDAAAAATRTVGAGR